MVYIILICKCGHVITEFSYERIAQDFKGRVRKEPCGVCNSEIKWYYESEVEIIPKGGL